MEEYEYAEETIEKETGQLRDVQNQAQKKTFTKWVNKNLAAIKKRQVEDLYQDLQDGTVLLDLLEALAGEKLPRSRLPGNQNNEIIWTNNIAEAFRCLQRHRVPLVNIHTSNIVDGEPKIILGLVWQLILHFQILQVLPQWTTDDVDSAPVHGDEKKQLLSWVNSKMTSEGDPVVNDFGVSWRNGVAFLSLVRNLVCERCSQPEQQETVQAIQTSLAHSDSRGKLDLAFGIAEDTLGVVRLLEVEDVAVDKPDERSVMMYVAEFVTEKQQQQQVQQQHAQAPVVEKVQPPVIKEVVDNPDRIPWECLAIAIVIVFIAFLFMFAMPPREYEEEETVEVTGEF